MCYRKNNCPMYLAGGVCNGCANCVHLLKAQKMILHARIGLGIAIIAFLAVTALFGNAYFI